MIASLLHLPEFFKPLYDNNEVYNRPQPVNLAKEFNRYSFLEHHPLQSKAIHKLFCKTVLRSDGTRVSFASLLQQDSYQWEDKELFAKMGFRQLNPYPERGVVLEHTSFPGWLIKTNYRSIAPNGRQRWAKSVETKKEEFPDWMLSSEPQTDKNWAVKIYDRTVKIFAHNDVINPLRVVMLENGRNWIKRLNLDRLKAAHEYLYLLPSCSMQAEGEVHPFHKKIVVISQKEQILGERNNLLRFAALAKNDPDKLRKIARQISLFITCNPLTDLHLNNMSFLADNSDTILFMDGEPIGWLADSSEPCTEKTFEQYDAGFYPILGLKRLQELISEQMKRQKIPRAEIQAVQQIFDEAINTRVQIIIWERKWHWIKFYALEKLRWATIASVILLATHAISRLFWKIFAPAAPVSIDRPGRMMNQHN